MANGKVKKYFKNLEKMMREGVNVPVPKKKAVVGKTNYGINWNKKTKVPKTRPADEIRTGGDQGGIGLTTPPTRTEQTTKTKQGQTTKTKQGKKPKNEIKQPPLESKHAGEVDLDNVEKVQTNVVEDYDKQARAYGKPPTEKTTEAKKQGKRIDKFGHKLDTAHELPRPRGGKKKYSYYLKTPAPASPSPVTPASPSPAPEAEKKKKKKKLTGNQVSQGVIGGTGEYIGTKYSNRLFGGSGKAPPTVLQKGARVAVKGGKTEKKSKKNKKKKGR